MEINKHIIKENSVLKIDLPEDFTINNALGLTQFVNQIGNFTKINQVIVDFSNLKKFDTMIVILVNKLQLNSQQLEFELIFKNLSNELTSYIQLLTFKDDPNIEANKPHWVVDHINFIGKNVQSMNKELFSFISFFGDVISKLVQIIFHPKNVRWRDFPYQFTNVGVYALPISAMIVFLIGLISGYQGALQLKQFGADTYIADLVGVALTRTLSPLLVAILVAGRSGSAFAAEIGSMKVSEEVDALKSMGFDVINFLVIPRIFAVMIAMPILVLICDLVGIIGGLIAALSTLNITIYGFIIRSQVALHYSDIFTGLFKSFIYGFLIALVGCFKGLRAKGGADAVGRSTTSAVVTSIFLIILCDSIFTILFQSLGL